MKNLGRLIAAWKIPIMVITIHLVIFGLRSQELITEFMLLTMMVGLLPAHYVMVYHMVRNAVRQEFAELFTGTSYTGPGSVTEIPIGRQS